MKGVKNNKAPSISLKLAQNYRVISVAYHEAAHIICGLLYYIKITGAQIYEQKRSVSGNTDYDTFYDDEQYNTIDNKIRDYLAISEIHLKYAGLAGEKIYFKDLSGSDNFPFVLKEGSLGEGSDMKEAHAIIKKYNLAVPGNKRYLFKQKIFRHTTTILKEYWDDVKLLAHALYDKRRLQEEDIKQILLKKSHNKKFWKKQLNIITSLFTQIDNAVVMHIIDNT